MTIRVSTARRPRRRSPPTPATPAQRTHDAVKAVCRAMLKSGKLGEHNGLPVTIVATTTLADLTAAAGRGPHRRRHPFRSRLSSGWLPRPIRIWRCSTVRGRFSSTTGAPGVPPAPDNAWSCTHSIGDARSPSAPLRLIRARFTTPNATGNTAATPISMNSPWPADATTAWSTIRRPDGPPENARATIEPNGFRPDTSTEGRPGSMSITIPSGSSGRMRRARLRDADALITPVSSVGSIPRVNGSGPIYR